MKLKIHDSLYSKLLFLLPLRFFVKVIIFCENFRSLTIHMFTVKCGIYSIITLSQSDAY